MLKPFMHIFLGYYLIGYLISGLISLIGWSVLGNFDTWSNNSFTGTIGQTFIVLGVSAIVHCIFMLIAFFFWSLGQR